MTEDQLLWELQAEQLSAQLGRWCQSLVGPGDDELSMADSGLATAETRNPEQELREPGRFVPAAALVGPVAVRPFTLLCTPCIRDPTASRSKRAALYPA
jgi:hypothetical protein